MPPEVNRERALKLIRAAFRKAAADKDARKAIADCLVIAQWYIEDVDLCFVVELNKGKIRVREGRTDYAGIIFKYRHAADFHFHAIGESSKQVKWWTGFECYGNRALQKYTSPIFHAMRDAYRQLVSPDAAGSQAPRATSAKLPRKKGTTKRLTASR